MGTADEVRSPTSSPTRWKRDLLVFGSLGVTLFALVSSAQWFEVSAIDRITRRQWFHGLEIVFIGLTWIVALALLAVAVLRWRWVPLAAFLGAQALGWATMAAWFVVGPVVEDYAARIPFESSRWKAENRERADPVRVHMVDDLLRRHRLVGMSRAKVNDLLGMPPETRYFERYDYVYWLGPERGAFSIDSEWLALKFKDDVVVEAKVLTD